MQSEIKGKPAFAYVDIELEPGESITAESDAMATMSADLDMKAHFNGGFFSGLCKKFLGGESLFVNTFTNNSNATRKLTVVQGTPGDTVSIDLNNENYCFQPGAYIASTPGIKLGLKWAGLGSFIGR